MLKEQDKAKIRQFVSNEKMVQAVKDVLLSSIEGDDIRKFVLDLVPQCKDDKELGENVRAVFMGMKLFEKSFKKLLEIGKEKRQGKAKTNPAV
ncbi:MAG: hypothetical protein U9O65_10600 [Thermotogota bacterium]|nr:hypothetical protein [Thermotogota bacterium]